MRWRTLVKLGVFIAVASLLAAMEIGTLTGPHVGSTNTYHAVFATPDGVSGLRGGNPVRVSGVAVGKVSGVKLLDATHAQVTFTANHNQQLTSNTWAVVRYANLLGQRYLALTQSGPSPGAPLKAGATIPAQHTAPALSLTGLFNGFRPLFAALSPKQVNDLSEEIIGVLQGQTARIENLVATTADLTANLADRDQTFNQVIDSVSKLLTTVAAHDNQLATTVTTLHGLTQQLHAEGPGIVDSLNSVDHLIGSVQGLLGQANASSLPADVTDLESITGVLAGNTGTVDKLINGFVQAFGDFDRVSQNGNWVNAYPCVVNIATYGQAQVTSAEAVSALQHLIGGPLGDLIGSLGQSVASLLALAIPLPLKLPTGQVGTGNRHTKVCS